MDECLSRCVIDFSGRPELIWKVKLGLKKLGEMFDNNWELALASYNGGPGYMSRQIKSQGTRNFWELELRKETHEYVQNFWHC